MPGRIKAGEGSLIGNAGEYLVVGELLRMGFLAALTPRGAAGFDVIATCGARAVNIRVKTKTSDAKGWRWNAKKDGSIFSNVTENDFVVLVDLNDGTSPVEYYSLPTQIVEEKVKQIFDLWVKTPGRNGRPHNPQNKVRFLGDDSSQVRWLRDFRGWHHILHDLRGE